MSDSKPSAVLTAEGVDWVPRSAYEAAIKERDEARADREWLLNEKSAAWPHQREFYDKELTAERAKSAKLVEALELIKETYPTNTDCHVWSARALAEYAKDTPVESTRFDFEKESNEFAKWVLNNCPPGVAPANWMEFIERLSARMDQMFKRQDSHTKSSDLPPYTVAGNPADSDCARGDK